MAKYIKTEQGYKTIEEIGAATIEQVEAVQEIAENISNTVKISNSINAETTYNQCLDAYNRGDNLIYVDDGLEYEFDKFVSNCFYFRRYDPENLKFAQKEVRITSVYKAERGILVDNLDSTKYAPSGKAVSSAIDTKITSPATATVGQTIIVKEVDASGKPTEWEAADYQPRTHGKEIVELLPNTTASFVEEVGGFMVECDFEFVVGNAYRVNWNGVIYNCVAVDMDGDAAIGNVDMVTGTGDSGEPFFVGALEGSLIAVPLDGSTELVIGVSGEVYQTIDKNYLPTDIMYGYPKYSYGAFDLEQYCWMEAGESGITNKTDGFVNTALTKEQFDILTEVFTNQVVYLDSCDMFVKPGLSGDAWQIQYTTLSHALGTVSVESVTLTLQWSDTEGCVQRSCEVRSNNLSLIS